MYAEWSKMNKTLQKNLKKVSFSEGIEDLLSLRETLMREMLSWKDRLTVEQFCAIPFLNANGYHSKTVAYSLWHIFRIEDIVVQTLICNGEQTLFRNDNLRKIGAPLITTGNELVGMEIAEFSKKLQIDALYAYISEVRSTTDAWLKTLTFEESKKTFLPEDAERILASATVSTDENARWLVDYWCGKDIKGLLQMPLSRHWIMHTEAAERIIKKITK